MLQAVARRTGAANTGVALALGVPLSVRWLGALAALAGPLVVGAVYARQLKKSDPGKISVGLSDVRRRSPKYVEARPLRSFHVVAFIAVVALPFVQWFAFLKFQTRLSFLLPLAATAGLMFVVGLFPRFVPAEQRRGLNRDAFVPVVVVAVALAATLILPPTGLVIVLRGAFTDIVGLMLVGHLMIAVQRKRTEDN